MESNLIPALLMSAIAFLIPLAQIALFKVLLHSGIKSRAKKCQFKQT